MSFGKILVIDHEEISCFLIERVMSRYGSTEQLSFSSNGKAALALLEKEAFDLILLEINSPFMEGTEFLQELNLLQEKKGEAFPKVVVITASVHHSFLAIPHHSVKGYLSKPFLDEHAKFLVALQQNAGIPEVNHFKDQQEK